MNTITINTKELKDTLKILNKTADKLSDISININKDSMFLGACDIHAKLAVISEVENINFSVRIKEFKKMIDSIKDKNISFEIEENTLFINGVYRLLINKEHESEIDFFENTEGKIITLPLDSFIKALNKTVFYSKEPFKPLLKGVNFNFTGNTLEIASTDGRCLNRETIDIADGAIEFNRTFEVNNIASFLMLTEKEKSIDGNINIKIICGSCADDDALIFSYKSFTFKLNAIEGKYPDINKIMPYKQEVQLHKYTTFSFNKTEAVEIIKNIAVAAKGKREKRIYLRIEKYGVSFIYLGNTKNAVNNTAGIYIKAEHNDIEGTIYAFNYEYILKIFDCLDNDNIEFNITKESEPAYILESTSEYLLMPIVEHDDNGHPKNFDDEDIILKYKVEIKNEANGIKNKSGIEVKEDDENIKKELLKQMEKEYEIDFQEKDTRYKEKLQKRIDKKIYNEYKVIIFEGEGLNISNILTIYDIHSLKESKAIAKKTKYSCNIYENDKCILLKDEGRRNFIKLKS